MTKEGFRCGFVSLVGRPNVGKSTLLNSLLKSKVSIVSPAPQTTRHRIRAILNLENAQVVFIDTPGIHSFKDSLARSLNTLAYSSIEGCDLILYVVDVARAFGEEEKTIMNFLLQENLKIIMVLNKIDLGKRFIGDYIENWRAKVCAKNIKDPLVCYLPVSAKRQDNIEVLKKVIVENLPPGRPFYPLDTLTDFPLKYRLADIVREKLCLNLKEELPHSLAVEVEEIKEEEKIAVIFVNIYVNRETQRAIVLGKKGSLIKEIGIASREEMEGLFQKRVYLDLKVKVLKDWQERPRILQELGYAIE